MLVTLDPDLCCGPVRLQTLPVIQPLSADAPSSGLLAAMLDQIDHPMFMVDAWCRVLHANRSGWSGQGGKDDPLQIDSGRLRATAAYERQRVAGAVMQVTRSGRRQVLELGPAECRTMVAVLPLANPSPAAAASGHGGERGALVIAGRRKHSEAAAARWFAACHGLTKAETRVMQALLEGLTPNQIAAHFEVSIGTVRTQLASARAKSGTSTLRALVGRAGTLPPLIGLLAPGDQ